MSGGSSKPFKVDFIGVGAPKCGTTWLSRCLEEHPQINFSKHKETDFFLTPESEVALRFYEPTKPHSFEDYKKEFPIDDKKIIGEFSVYYLYDLDALRRIKKAFPKVRIIISLRNPIDFLNSAYWFYKSSRYAHLIPDTLGVAIKSALPIELYHIGRVKFYSYVKDCLDIFGRGNVLVILMDDIKFAPLEVLKKLYAFLGVGTSFVPPVAQKVVHDTRSVHSTWLSRITYLFFEWLKKRRMLFSFYDKLNGGDRLYHLYNKFFKREFKYPKVSASLKKDLISKLSPDIEKLEKLIDRDLSAWKK